MTVACLGLSFKADIDDLRESPAMAISAQLAALPDYRVLAVEPHIDAFPASLDGAVELVSLEAAVEATDILLLLVDHRAFRAIDTDALEPVAVVDTRGAWRNLVGPVPANGDGPDPAVRGHSRTTSGSARVVPLSPVHYAAGQKRSNRVAAR